MKDTSISEQHQDNIEEAGDEYDPIVVDDSPLSRQSEDSNEETVKDVVKESKKETKSNSKDDFTKCMKCEYVSKKDPPWKSTFKQSKKFNSVNHAMKCSLIGLKY